MPKGVFFEDLLHRPTGSDRENHVKPITDFRILLNADFKILAKQIPRQFHDVREMIAKPQAGHFRDNFRARRRGVGIVGREAEASSDLEEILMERPFATFFLGQSRSRTTSRVHEVLELVKDPQFFLPASF